MIPGKTFGHDSKLYIILKSLRRIASPGGFSAADRTCKQTENDRKFAKMIANMQGQTLSTLKELHLSLINLI